MQSTTRRYASNAAGTRSKRRALAGGLTRTPRLRSPSRWAHDSLAPASEGMHASAAALTTQLPATSLSERPSPAAALRGDRPRDTGRGVAASCRPPERRSSPRHPRRRPTLQRHVRHSQRARVLVGRLDDVREVVRQDEPALKAEDNDEEQTPVPGAAMSGVRATRRCLATIGGQIVSPLG